MTKNLVETVNDVRYRQTFNQWSMNWGVPKILTDDGKWKPIERSRLMPVITKENGYRFALWRMRKVMLSIKDEYGRQVWKVNQVSTKHVTIKDIKYSIFQFDCHRVAHGIVGGMNTAGGAR